MDAVPGLEVEAFVSEVQEVTLTWTFDPHRPHEMKALAFAMLYPTLLSPGIQAAGVLQALPLPSEVKAFFETLTPTAVAVQGGVKATSELALPVDGLTLKEKGAVFVGMEIRRHPDALEGITEIRQTVLVEVDGGGELGPLGPATGALGMRVASQAEVTLVQPDGGGAFVEIRLQLEGEKEASGLETGVEIQGTATQGRTVVIQVPRTASPSRRWRRP